MQCDLLAGELQLDTDSRRNVTNETHCYGVACCLETKNGPICLSLPSEQTKVGGSAGGGSFEDVLSSAAQASAQNNGPTASTNDLRENNQC